MASLFEHVMFLMLDTLSIALIEWLGMDDQTAFTRGVRGSLAELDT
jgi:hypothetical protein